MARVMRTGEFFVVGGPVQPDRPCYLERASDLALYRSIAELQFSYVLSPRASGKSSLMARTIRTLRAERQLAAVVDLTQIGARGESSEAGRWFYSIAYRILRELRLKLDLQTWWQEKSALMGEQRLAEFFWEVVLANTTAPVTIFFDEVEQAVELPFSRQLFAAIHACYGGRTTEPDLERLNFVVLGVAAPRQLSPDRSLSPFEDGRAIDLQDFTLEETYGLSPGFGVAPEQAQAVLDRIYDWVRGQPYLTQKIARGVSRRGAEPEDVDRVVRETFLAQAAFREEPLINHIRALLTQRGSRARQALVLLGRVGKGAQVLYDPGSASQQTLRLSGVVVPGAEGQLAFRNPLFKSLFTSRWVSSALPFNWRGASVAAVLVAAMLLIPVWYFQYLPRPYIQTLSSVTQDFEVALDAHERLGRLPGFRGTADRLLAGVMARRSREAETFVEVRSADAVLRGLTNQGSLADELLGEYWLRRARQAVRAERRDEALLLATAALKSQGDPARQLAGELIGDDYAALLRSYRLADVPVRWEVDWGSNELTVVDQAHGVQRLPLTDAGPRQLDERLTALQHVPVSRELSVNMPGSAAAFALELELEHPAKEQVLISLQAPSGARASFRLDPGSAGVAEIIARGRSPIAGLADEDRQGVWRLTLVDQRAGAVGQLIRWGLHFAEEVRGWEDEPEQGLEIPDPVRTEQVEVELSADGTLAIARPSRTGAVGAVALWDLRQGVSTGDLQLEAEPRFVASTGDTSRVVSVTDNTLSLWDVEGAEPVARVATQTGFVLPPTVAMDGDYVAIAERLDVAGSLYSLLHTADGELVASVAGLPDVSSWVLGPQARYLVLVGPLRRVRVMDPRDGEVMRELVHEHDAVRLIPVPSGDWLLSVDVAGEVLAWRLGQDDGGSAAGGPHYLGTTIAPDSVSVAADGSTVAFEQLQGHVVVRGLARDRQPANFRIHQRETSTRTRLAPDGSRLVTASGSLLQLWRLEDRPAVTGVEAVLSVLALDRAGAVAVLGFRDGHIGVRHITQLRSGEGVATDVEYIGHRGAVSAVAVDAELSLAVSGGSDGVVRSWNLRTGAPRGPIMRHPEGPINSVALSPNGQWFASAAEYSARIWSASEGALVLEVPVNGRALSLSFSPEPIVLAVGDSAGNVFLAAPTGTAPPRSARAESAVTALAFSPDRRFLASGDAAGGVRLWDSATAGRVGDPHVFSHPVRWLGFTQDGEFLLVQTNHWIHRLGVHPRGLFIVASRLLEVGVEVGAALTSPDGDQLRLVGRSVGSEPLVHEVDLSRVGTADLPEDSPLLLRDWSRILALRLDESGAVVPALP